MNLNESQKNPIDGARQRRFKGVKEEPAATLRRGAKPENGWRMDAGFSLIITFLFIFFKELERL